jgi:hypothetical protein
MQRILAGLRGYDRAVRLSVLRLWGLAALACLAGCCAWAASASALPAGFGSNGARAGQLSNKLGGIAIEQETGDVYISDRGNDRIDKFGPEGEFILAFGWGVADGESEELQSCTSTCFKGLEGSGAGEFFEEGGAAGIAVDSDPLSLSHGDVYVADPANNRVQKFSPQGQFLTMFGGEVNASTKGDICPASEAASCQAGVEGSGPGQFEGLADRSVAVDSSTATVYVGDRNRLQRFSEEGASESEILFSGIGRIRNLALDSAKDIYLWGGLQEGVHEYDQTGFELPPPRDQAAFAEGLAITIGPGDELLLNDLQENHHILAFDPEGQQTASFDRGGLDQNGGQGIAYSAFTNAIYILNEGVVRIVTQPPPGPFILLESESATEVEPTSATLNASANPEGPEASKCHFDYGTSTAYGKETPEEGLSGGPFEDQPIKAQLTGLSPSTTYHFRASCENAAKEASTGTDETFTTLPPVSIDATSTTEVNATSARLQAELNPHGLASEYRFEYGTSTAYGTSVPLPDGSLGASSADTTVENLIQELLPATTYHYRVVAHNALNNPGEVVEGPDRSFTTQGPSSILADGRSWEMVSPANKHGSPLEPLTAAGGLIQAAQNGGAFAYVALGPIDTEPKGNRSSHDTQLLARRSSGGWSTQDITTPHEEVSIANGGNPSEYKLFAEDLHAGIAEPEGVTPLSALTTERTPYRREADGEFVPLVTASNVPAGTKFGGKETPGTGLWVNGVSFDTATPDLGHVVLVSPQALAPGFGPGFEPGGPNLYELAGGALTLVSVLPNGEPTAEAGLSAGVALDDRSMRGAIASDGSRVVFETPGHLYVRDVGLGQTLRLDERQPGAGGGESVPTFRAANSDDSRVLFSDGAQLTPDATAKPNLYMCEVEVVKGQLSCALSDLSVDPNAGEAANVAGTVSAIDASAEHVYFAADGVLTSEANARGEVAVPGSCNSNEEAPCNLYEYDTSKQRLSLVAVLSSRDSPDWAGLAGIDLSLLTARASPDGHYFTFMSQRSLTGYDNRDAHSGQPDEEVFQLDSHSGALRCISCDPTGARPNGIFDKENPGPFVDRPHAWPRRWLASSTPGWTLQALVTARYQSRYLSNSGREFFNSADALVPQDTNKVEDVYQFEPPGVGDCTPSSKTYAASSGGCVSLISSGSSVEESAFLDASQSGDEVFFLTNARLLGSDVDSAFDVYDAHVCSASSPCPPPPPPPAAACEGDSCQNPSPPLASQIPGSLSYSGPENPPPPAKAKPKPPSRAELLAKALKACKKHKQKRKRVACARRARKRYATRKPAKKARTHAGRTGRGGARAGRWATASPTRPSARALDARPAPGSRCCSASWPSPTLAISATPAGAASPWWRLTSRTIPTHIAPGSEGTIIVQAVNLGNAQTSAPYSFTDELPAGLALQGVEYFAPSPFESGTDLGPAGPFGVFEFCKTTASSATCTSEGSFFGFPILLNPVLPYEILEMRLKVKDEGATPGAINETQVSGAGAKGRTLKRGVAISSSLAGFGIGEFTLVPEEEGGEVDAHAGTHPYQLTNTISFNRDSTETLKPPALVRNLDFKLPPGQVGNATALPQCSDQDFGHVEEGGSTNACPGDTAIGVAVVTASLSPEQEHVFTVPVFNLTPAIGEPARFGFDVVRSPVILDTAVRSGPGEDYGVTVSVKNTTEIVNFISATTVFWGAPADPSHNASRGWGCVLGGHYQAAAGQECELSHDAHPGAFLTLPANCNEPFDPSAQGTSWPTKAAPEGLSFGPITYNLADPSGNPLSLSGCNQLSFAPSIKSTPTSQSASSPSGLDFDLNFDDEGLLNASGAAESQIKDASVALPEGLTINPSAGVGLQGCTPAEYERESAQSQQGEGCPNAAKLGTVEITTPLLAEAIHGAIYIAEPYENPFPEPGHPGGTLVALYIVAKSPRSGVLIRLAGKVDRDPITGQLTTTFLNNPQLPFDHFNFHFREGQQAPLITPPTCATYTTRALMSPWSEPLATLTDTSPFQIMSGAGAGACPAGAPPFSPQIQAGTQSNAAGAFSPFQLRLSRGDGESEITSFSTNLPPGLTGILTGIPFCPEADIALARTKTGSQEQASPSCPQSSLLGHSQVGTGVGAVLAYTPGEVYLAGPYGGDPFSLISVTSAVVGPFDLGTVVLRFGLRLDPHTVQVSVDPSASEPIPHIIDGIVTHVREIRVAIDRPGFTLNPTNCNRMSISSTLGSSFAQSATVSSPFQASSCASLKFAPKFSVSTNGKTSKASGASLHVKLAYPPNSLGSYANIAKVKVSLPKQLPSRLSTLQKACTAQVFEQDPSNCPAASRVGQAKVLTPAIPEALQGPAYFVSHGGEAFPDLTIVLKGYGVTVDLVGSTQIKNGITTSTFKATPDVPFNSFELTLPQGSNSALAANVNLCRSKLAMPSEFTAQNGVVLTRSTPIRVTGCAKAHLTRHQRLLRAIKQCRRKHGKTRRRSCEAQARRRFGAGRGRRRRG